MEAVLTQPNTTLVDITLRDNVAILALNRPKKRNAVNNEMRSELTSVLHWADQSTDVAAIVLTGQGKGFCAGVILQQCRIVFLRRPGVSA